MDENGPFLEQAGVVPWRERAGGREVLLITSRRTGQWIVPKGMVEAHLGQVGSAVEEAWEEAGVRGDVHPRPLGQYSHDKWGKRCRVVLFALRVTEVLDDWPEAGQRERVWVPLHQASDRVGNPELAQLLWELNDAPPLGGPALRISWVPSDIIAGPGRVGVCSLPGERPNSLVEDLAELRQAGVTHLVCLVEASELASLDPPETSDDRARAVHGAGLGFHHVPIGNFEAPTLAQVQETVKVVSTVLAQGGTVVMHCWAGLGRTGTMLACVFVSRGMTAHDAIVTARHVRPGAIEAEVQEELVRAYASAS